MSHRVFDRLMTYTTIHHSSHGVSVGSWQAVTGANSYIMGGTLGHKDQKSTAVYARLNIDPIRASLEKATDAMLEMREE